MCLRTHTEDRTEHITVMIHQLSISVSPHTDRLYRAYYRNDSSAQY